MALVEQKGHDYNFKQQKEGDTLHNLRVASILGVVDSPSRSVLIRILDKVQRIISLNETDPQVKGESIRDTVLDLHNYVDYWYIFKMEGHAKDNENELH